jgi:zinc transporter
MIDGLIYGYQLDGNGGARRIGLAEDGGTSTRTGHVWIHLDYTQDACRDWIQQQSGVDELVVEALCAEDTRPRASEVDDGMLIALRGVNLNPGMDPEDMVSIRLWIDGRRIISTQRRRLVSVEQLAESLAAGRGPPTIGDLLVELVDRLTTRIGEVTDQAEDTAFELEEEQLTTEHGDLRQEIASLRRQVISLRRYMAPQREALAKLHAGKVSWLSESNRLSIREVGDRLTRHLEDLDAVRERASVAQEELASRLSEQVNQRMYALSIIAGIFLPLGFLTGLLGINVGGIPGSEAPLAFWIFIAILVAIVAIQVWLFRRWEWL